MSALRDFFAGEWKTLTALAALGLIVLVLFEIEQETTPDDRPSANVIPGASLLEVSLGDNADRVRGLLGEPAETTSLLPGVTAWRYPSQGLEVHLVKDQVIAIRGVVRPPEPSIDPAAFDRGGLLPEASPAEPTLTYNDPAQPFPRLRAVFAQRVQSNARSIPAAPGVSWSHFPGVIIVSSNNEQHQSVIREVIVVPIEPVALPFQSPESTP